MRLSTSMFSWIFNLIISLLLLIKLGVYSISSASVIVTLYLQLPSGVDSHSFTGPRKFKKADAGGQVSKTD